MKSVILKFSFLVIVVVIFFSTLSFFVFRKINATEFHKVDENIEVLIIGNSQSEFGLDDKIIPHSINLSQSGDCSFYNYFKGKKILEENPNIKTVLYLYTNNMFLTGMDEWIYDEKHLGYKYPKYAHSICLSDQVLLMKKNPSSYFIALRDAVRTDIQLLLRRNGLNIHERLDWGAYQTSDVVGDLNAKDEEFDKFYSDTTTSTIDINYIKKFYNYCSSSDVTLILVRTPFHKSFPKVKEKELLSFYQEELEMIPFYDYVDSVFYDYEYKDIQHLNRDGSTKLSNMVTDQLIKDKYIKTK